MLKIYALNNSPEIDLICHILDTKNIEYEYFSLEKDEAAKILTEKNFWKMPFLIENFDNSEKIYFHQKNSEEIFVSGIFSILIFLSEKFFWLPKKNHEKFRCFSICEEILNSKKIFRENLKKLENSATEKSKKSRNNFFNENFLEPILFFFEKNLKNKKFFEKETLADFLLFDFLSEIELFSPKILQKFPKLFEILEENQLI